MFTLSIPPFSLTKMLQCGLCSESIEEIFDESTVKKYVKSDLGNSSWVIGSGYNRILGHLSILFLVLSSFPVGPQVRVHLQEK